MAQVNGTNGHTGAPIEDVLKMPTLEDLKRIYDEGIPQTLISRIEVVMRPVQEDKLLMASNLPNQLTELVMTMMFPPPQAEPGPETFPDELPENPVEEFVQRKREQVEDIKEFLRSVDIVCEAALVDPSVLPYLDLRDRLWLFKMAFWPVAMLRNFRLKPLADVGIMADGAEDAQQAEQPAAVDAEPVQTEPADSVPV